MGYRFGLDHFALLVRDVERSTAFYRNVMGFSPIERSGSAGVQWLEIGGGDAIHLIQGDFGATHVTKDTHVAVSTADFDAFVRHLNEIGVEFTDWPGNPGQIGVHRNGFQQIYVQDPDGYWIEINDHRPPVGA
ncbi:catechol 2,3-dioxygenase-like lactoylglutathione lyase family enzyme [Pararhizobium capsulatum DSM 1112]|uniref:Catechol 2,3-dioxygenase-like lactoylglutathione lyase family enzyme n=1 Tax=Pararhizobium capsulatum DSM 1112 TaxID=1121113 RepID=A0ABU0BQK2_9HYPH|nr:VOC family protein [Pararhizobium capsulatum]MDQ0320532.1 catechol 2,3-dioxygenase-like lactoylglutathione lyase family enzyme [Pararhizobium capsulatum DSM 1112]